VAQPNAIYIDTILRERGEFLQAHACFTPPASPGPSPQLPVMKALTKHCDSRPGTLSRERSRDNLRDWISRAEGRW
jgi:hypothetical protein